VDQSCQILRRLAGESGDELGKLFFVAIGLFKSELFCVRGEVTVLELGFDVAHGGCETVFAVVAFSVAPFSFMATGKSLISRAGLCR